MLFGLIRLVRTIIIFRSFKINFCVQLVLVYVQLVFIWNCVVTGKCRKAGMHRLVTSFLPVLPREGLLTAILMMTTVRMLTKQVMTTTAVTNVAKCWFQESKTQASLSVREAMNLEQVSRYETEG